MTITLLKNLHKKARFYCIENFEYWINIYQNSRNKRPSTFNYTYEKSDYDIFPRYQANEALLQGVEEINPDEFNSIDKLKEAILESALKSETIFTKDNYGTIKHAINDEKNKFKEFIENLQEYDFKDVPNLFYRRKLKTTENEYWRNELKRFNIDFSGFWLPKNEIKNNENEYLIFDEDEVTKLQESAINEIIKKIVCEKYFVFNEDNVNYELETETFDIFNLSPETYVFDRTLEWIIYYSHEDYYILKNEYVASEIKAKFDNLSQNMISIIANL